MRGLLKFAGILILIAGIYSLHYYWDLSGIRKDSSVFITDAVGAITSAWDIKEFQKYADANVGASKDMEAAFNNYKKLGKPRSAAGCEIEDFTTYLYPGTTVRYVSATYQCMEEFASGPATIHAGIYRFSDKPAWKIQSFILYSAYLSKPGDSRKQP